MQPTCDEHAGEQFVRRCDACAALAGSKARVVSLGPDRWPPIVEPPNPWAGIDA